MINPEAVDDINRLVFTGHNKRVAHMTIQDWHKIKPDKTPAWKGMVVTKKHF